MKKKKASGRRLKLDCNQRRDRSKKVKKIINKLPRSIGHRGKKEGR